MLSMFVAVFAACTFILRSTFRGEFTLCDGDFTYSGGSEVLQSITKTKTTECRLVLGLTERFFWFFLLCIPGLLYFVVRALYRKSVHKGIREKVQNFFPPLWISTIILWCTAIFLCIGYILVTHGDMSVWGAAGSITLGILAFVAMALVQFAIMMFILKITAKHRTRIVRAVQSTAWYARLMLVKHAVCKNVIYEEIST